jgi:hypothetical protein
MGNQPSTRERTTATTIGRSTTARAIHLHVVDGSSSISRRPTREDSLTIVCDTAARL